VHDQEPAAGAGPADVGELRLGPHAGGPGDDPGAADDVDPCRTQRQERRPERSLEVDEADRTRQGRNPCEARAPRHPAGGTHQHVAQAGGAILLSLEVEPAQELRVELTRREARLGDEDPAHQ
jgi:hypothetical protein